MGDEAREEDGAADGVPLVLHDRLEDGRLEQVVAATAIHKVDRGLPALDVSKQLLRVFPVSGADAHARGRQMARRCGHHATRRCAIRLAARPCLHTLHRQIDTQCI